MFYGAVLLIRTCAVQLIFPLGVLMAIPWCVESPRWLASRGRYSEVYKTLARLHGKDATPTSEEILRTGQMIVSTAEHEASIQSSWKAVRNTRCAVCIDQFTKDPW